MSENDDVSAGGERSGPDAGLSQTGRTADDFEPGDRTASDYAGPAGLDNETEEEA